MGFWFDDDKRLEIAKRFQEARIDYMQTIWSKHRDLQSNGFSADDIELQSHIKQFQQKINEALSTSPLLQA